MGTVHNYKMFKVFTRKFKTSELRPPGDVLSLFRRFGDGDSHISAEQLRRFMVVHQCETRVSVVEAERIIEEVVHQQHHLTKYARRSLNIDDFFHFLFSSDLNGPIKTKVHHDMSAPLSHYYIYTGHNSYLTGNQLSSDCSDAPIIKALEDGVRVIELDVWPNSTKDDILVLHGRTLTTPVLLIKCLKSIKEYGFVSSEYPVIITLEDHLTPCLQGKVAQMLIKTFGPMLYYPESQQLEEFPSPESLKGRIVISTKPPKEYLESDDASSASLDRRDSFESGTSETCDLAAELPLLKKDTELPPIKKDTELPPIKKDTELPPIKKDTELPPIKKDTELPPIKKDVTAETQQADDKYGSETEDDDVHPHLLSCKTIRSGAIQYKLLIAIHSGKPKNGIEEALKVYPDKVRRLSLSELGLEKAVIANACDLFRFTQKNILRVYPKGTRVDSSNYNPFLGWMHGVQMVAFNMQGYGKPLWLMQGLFRANGGCGYFKKPDFLIGDEPSCPDMFDPTVKLDVKTTLHVKIYMGDGWRLDFSPTHFDRYSPPDFYAKVCIIGVPADTAKRRTKTIEDDWCPIWDEEFTFELTVPELAFLRIEVKEYNYSEKNEFGGQNCIPIPELRSGIRAVPLFDKKGKRLKSVRLLMRFEFIETI